MKTCIICGNSKVKELEPITLYSDAEGNKAEEKEYICKEERGCNK